MFSPRASVKHTYSVLTTFRRLQPTRTRIPPSYKNTKCAMSQAKEFESPFLENASNVGSAGPAHPQAEKEVKHKQHHRKRHSRNSKPHANTKTAEQGHPSTSGESTAQSDSSMKPKPHHHFRQHGQITQFHGKKVAHAYSPGIAPCMDPAQAPPQPATMPLRVYCRGPYQMWLLNQFQQDPHFFQPLHQRWLLSFGYELKNLRWEYHPDPMTWPPNNSVFSLLHMMRQLDPTVVPKGIAGAYREDEPLPDHLKDTDPASHVYIGGPRYDNPELPHPFHPGNQELARLNQHLLAVRQQQGQPPFPIYQPPINPS